MALLSTLVVWSVVAALAYLAVISAAAVVSALRLGGRRQDPIDNHDAQSSSRFTIPVSVIVPLPSGSADSRIGGDAINQTITSLIALDYPELEVIVVAEDLPKETWAAVKAEWQLEPREYFYRQTLTTAAVRKVYRSTCEPRLLVVDKTPSASRADAMNCGVNLAHFRYVTAIAAGIAFDRDALLRAMAAPLRDPAGVAAATSHIEIVPRLGRGWQRLPSVRSILRSRIASSAAPSIVLAHDSVVVWRRDAVVQLEGFSTQAADPDVDMAIRVQLSPKIAGSVVRSPEIFGSIDAPSMAVRMRSVQRRQRAALQAIATLRGAGAEGRRMLMLAMASDLLTPIAQAWVVVATMTAAAAGWILWRNAFAAVLLVSFGRAAVSAAALLVRGSAPKAPDAAEVALLLLIAPGEFVVASPSAVLGRVLGIGTSSKLN